MRILEKAAVNLSDEGKERKKKQTQRPNMKYILVTGGVVSGLGKGVIASSIGLIMKSCGFRVTTIKIDPYLNVDAGTMSPIEHGEVSVLDDGGEEDLDLGNYERFLDLKLTRDNNITTGKIYQYVIEKERKGDYLGKTVQIVPHMTDAIQEWIDRVAHVPVDGQEGSADICVIELGGTIGDIESRMYTEALGQFSYRVGAGNFCLIHVVPVLNVVGEQKTKPTQHSVGELRSLGLKPDILACRSTTVLDESVVSKLSQFCHIPVQNIASMYDVPNIWHIPLILRDQMAHEAILQVLNLSSVKRVPKLEEWTTMAKLYDTLQDHHPAILHSSVTSRKKYAVVWVAADELEETTRMEVLKKAKLLKLRVEELDRANEATYRETVERRYFTVTGENPDEKTLDFLQKAIQEQGRGRIIYTIAEIQERHDAVMDMEKNLRELRQMFLDLAVLVSHQGEQLNDIEDNVMRTSSYVENGNRQLIKARSLQKNTWKWTCYALFSISVSVLYLRPWKM